MQALTNRSKTVSKKEMTLVERMYLPAIFSGMIITFKHFFRKPVTIQYPEQKREFSKIYRGQHVLKRDEIGAERCTACGLCAVACPAEAITMVAAERKPGEEKLYREEKYAAVYEINMLRCIFCGDCEEACPKEAIFLTDRKVDSFYTRKEFIYGKKILVEGIEKDKRVDVSVRETTSVGEFKKHNEFAHNETFDKNKKTKVGGHTLYYPLKLWQGGQTTNNQQPTTIYMNSITTYLFYLLSFLAIMFALMVVFSKNPVHSVLYLVLTFFTIAGHYVLLNAQFLAAVHVIVYAGAIMVLFLFVIMLLNLNKETEPHKSIWLKASAAVAAGSLLVVLVGTLKETSIMQPVKDFNPNIGLIENLGMTLFNDFLLPFEVSSILLLAAMVGAVMLGKKSIK